MIPREPAPLGRLPLLPATLAGAGALFAAQVGAWALLVAAVVFLLAGGIYYGRKPIAFAGVIALVFSLNANHQRQKQAELRNLIATEQRVALTGVVLFRAENGFIESALRTSEGAKVALRELPAALKTGDLIQLEGAPLGQREARNPAGFDFAKELSRRGYAGTLEVERAGLIRQTYGWVRLRGVAESFRETMIARVTNGISHDRRSSLITALLLGEKSDDRELLMPFRETGTMHIFAVSGLHIGMVALLVFGLARLANVPPRATAYLVIIAMATYAFITGLRPPALRAFLMATIVLSGFLLHRRSAHFNSLCFAALVVLLVDPFQLWQPGFQLSFIVVGAIFAIEPHLWKRVRFLAEQDPYLPRPLWNRWQRFSSETRTKVLRLGTVSLAAWIGSAPLSAIYFGWFTPIAVLASGVLSVFAFGILATALFSIAVSFLLTPASTFLNQVNLKIAQSAEWSAQQFADFPIAHRRVQGTSEWKDGLVVFDLTYGAAALHLDAGGGVLIDGGNDFHYWRTVRPALLGSSLTADSLIATHADNGHVGGFLPLLESNEVRQILLPRNDSGTGLAELRAQAAPSLIEASEGQILPIAENYKIEALNTGGDPVDLADDRSLVLMIHLGDWRVLYTSDAGYQTERKLLANRIDLAADVWILGRHASDLTGCDAFVEAISPQVVIASHDELPAAEQVPPSWLNWLRREGIIVLSQEDHGAVFLRPKGRSLEIASFLKGKITTLSRHD